MHVVSPSYSSSKLNELLKQKLHKADFTNIYIMYVLPVYVGKEKKKAEEKFLQGTISFTPRNI